MGREQHSISYLQSTVLHEFGHTLGLGHVNGAGNSDANYGVILQERDDVMGMGDHSCSIILFPVTTVTMQRYDSRRE